MSLSYFSSVSMLSTQIYVLPYSIISYAFSSVLPISFLMPILNTYKIQLPTANAIKVILT